MNISRSSFVVHWSPVPLDSGPFVFGFLWAFVAIKVSKLPFFIYIEQKLLLVTSGLRKGRLARAT